MDDQDQKVVDGEVVETPQETTSEEDGKAQVLLSLDTMIKSNIKALDTLATELKKNREMLEDAFVNDPTFKEHAEAAKKAAKVKSETRSQIMKQPQIAQLANKVKELSAEIKQRKLELSDYLLSYQQLSGATSIEQDNGDVLEIVNEARLLKRSAKK